MLPNDLKSLESNIFYDVIFYATKRQIKVMSIVTTILNTSFVSFSLVWVLFFAFVGFTKLH